MSKLHPSFQQTLFGRKFFYLPLSVILIGLCGFAYLPSKKVSGQETPQACNTCSQMTERTIYAPTIGLPEAAGADIVLNCRSIHEMEATPTFYTADGEAIVGETIRLQPSEIRFVSVESLIPEEHRGRHVWGGMSLSYNGMLMEMWAQISLKGTDNRGSADVTFNVLNNLGSDTQEAVWRQPTPGKTVIALGNSSDSQIHTTVQFSDGDTQKVDIAPFATRYIRRNNSNNSGSSQSVKLITNGAAGSLKAVGYVTSGSNSTNNRFASSIRFYDTQGIVQPKLFANNFRVKNSESHLLLKNTTTASITAQAHFRPTDGSGEPVTLQPITLNPSEITEVNLRVLQTAAINREDLDSVSVEIDNTGAAGSLIGALYSKNQTTGVVYDVPLRDSGRLRNSTGAYPWRLDDDYTSVVTLTNTSSEPTQYRATVFYNGGRYMISPYTLAIGETTKFDLKRIRDEHIPDAFGNTIPESATSGQFTWSILRPTNSSRLIGRSEVVSKSNRVSSSYSCGLSCPDSGPSYRVDFSPINVFAGESANSNVEEVWTSSNGWSSGYPGSMPYLYTGDSSIATSAMIQNGLMKTDGYAAGDVYWYSGQYTYSWYFDGGFDCFLQQYQQEDYGGIEVAPRITSITPIRGGVGSTTRVTINGSGFTFSPTVNAGSGISVSIFSITGGGQIVADFTIAANATGGNRNVTVSANGQTSNAVNFFVQIPTSLSVLSVTVIPTPTVGDPETSACEPGLDFGISVAIKYQVNDQGNPSSPIKNNVMIPQETFTNFVLNGVSQSGGSSTYDDLGPSNVTGTSRTTDVNGQFVDAPLGFCANGSFTSFSFVQNIRVLIDNTQNSYHVRTNNFAFTSTASGQGSVTNNSDIQKSRP
jgi:hypothetical protein